jgi:endonuclease/exonuclease/phosphatase family metal-dependent hydrolase
VVDVPHVGETVRIRNLHLMVPVVRGATYPSGRPLLQLDHVLVSCHWAVDFAGVLRDVGSDHRGVRAVLRRTGTG